jgi:hypothetical protein
MLHTSSAKSHPEQQPIVTFAARAKQAAKPGPMFCAPFALQVVTIDR